MAWRVLAASKLLGTNPSQSLVSAPVRTVRPLVAAVLIGAGASRLLYTILIHHATLTIHAICSRVDVMHLHRYLRDHSAVVCAGGTVAVLVRLGLLLRCPDLRHRPELLAAGASGAGVGAAVVFLRTHGVAGLPTLALIAAAAGFLTKHSGARRRVVAPHGRRGGHRANPLPTGPSASTAAHITADATYVSTRRFVTPPPLVFGQVSHYAPPRIPTNRYIAPAGSAMIPTRGSHATPDGGAGPPQNSSDQTSAATFASAATSIASDSLFTTPVRGSATVRIPS